MEAFDFMFDPLCVGDISTIGFAEEIEENKVNAVIDYVDTYHNGCVTFDEMENIIKRFNINYILLPQWLKDKIDDEVYIIEER